MEENARALAQAVAADEARRASRWQLRFRLGWGILIALRAGFVLISLNVEIDFIARATPFILEGIGEDFLPKNVDFDLIDHFEKVTDKDAALMTREIVRQEGIWVGNSCGSAMAGLLQLKENFKEGETVVIIFHDHGTRYLGKIFNDDWMRSKGYLPDAQ